MLPYIIIILATVIILGFIFGRRHNDEKSDYQPPVFKHSGHEWVFNGILDIDHPPLDDTPFHDYERPIQLMVKKGYMHYDMIPESTVSDSDCGLFHAVAQVLGDGSIGIYREGRVVAHLERSPEALCEAINAHGGKADAYAFIASKGNPAAYYGEVCIVKA